MKLHESLEESFEGYAEGEREDAEIRIDSVLKTLEMCESVVEQKFLLHMIQILNAEAVFVSDDFIHIAGHDEFDGFVAIYPQAQIAIGSHNYRADFLFVYKTRHPFTEHFRLVVEIDGHDYHERTKKQAMRDKQRDRLMQMEGYVVFRFTGSEIYHGCSKAVWEVHDYMRTHQKRISIERGMSY
jgi:very-short-patch-repair endonuclease